MKRCETLGSNKRKTSKLIYLSLIIGFVPLFFIVGDK
jgi:hypothetical protein